MKKAKKMPLGIQSFKDLREKEFVYIDKTKFVFKMISSGKIYFLSRPRRFGKSLLLSTIENYFLGRRELFDDLYIQKLEDAKEDAWREHPVLRIDLNASRYETEEDLEAILSRYIAEFEKIYGKNNSEKTIADRFFGVIKRAYEQTGMQVVILVDEYDKPLLQTLNGNEELNEKYRKILKAFFGVIKSTDEYIRFVFFTGVTRFSKISIFSDLNSPTDISLRNDYAEICGITQKELEANFQTEIEIIAHSNEMSINDVLAKLKDNYNGYKFAKKGEKVYNPYSLLNSIDAKDFEYYWFSTGTPTFLIQYLKKVGYNIPDLDGNVDLNTRSMERYKAEPENPLPILYQTGYLTIKDYDSDYCLYKLGFPNSEVKYGFLENLLPNYLEVSETTTDYSIVQFTKELRANKIDDFIIRLKSIVASIPYDNFTKKQLNLREQNYQTAIYLIFALMGQFIQTEIHCATGRADCVVETENSIFIFEFKLDGIQSSKDALEQIKQKNYAEKYSVSKKQIFLIGVSFDNDARNIKEWAVEEK